jgi:hypothetical protein
MGDPEVRSAVPLRPVPDAIALAERRARRAELAERAQAGRADAAEALAAELSVRLARLEAQLARGDAPPPGRVGELEVELRRAWQQAFAEQKRREEIEEASRRREEVLRTESERLRAELSRARERVEELRLRVRALERDAEAARWRDDAAAAPAVEPEPEVAVSAAPSQPGPDRVAGLRKEAELARAHLDLGPVPEAPDPNAVPPATPEVSMVEPFPWPEPAAEPPAPAAGEPPSPAVPPEPPAPAAAPEPPTPAATEAAALVEAVADASPASPPAAPPPPDAFDAARNRLRAATPTPGPVFLPPRRTGAAWVASALSRLARHDAERAGKVLLALVPAHHLASPGPLVYRLDVPGHVTRQVLVAGGRTRLGDDSARPDVTVEADLSALAAHLIRRGIQRHRARVQVTGPRRQRRALRALGRMPVRLADLHENGVVLGPELAYALIGAQLPPDVVAKTPFILVHDDVTVAADSGGLHVVPGGPDPDPHTRIVTGPAGVLPFLLGREEPAELSGSRAVARRIQAWVAALEAAPDGPGDRPDRRA